MIFALDLQINSHRCNVFIILSEEEFNIHIKTSIHTWLSDFVSVIIYIYIYIYIYKEKFRGF